MASTTNHLCIDLGPTNVLSPTKVRKDFSPTMVRKDLGMGCSNLGMVRIVRPICSTLRPRPN